MSKIKFKYKKEKGKIFPIVKRPKINILVFSYIYLEWVPVDDVLADTGADISVLPQHIGELIVKNIKQGKEITVRGFIPKASIEMFIHNLKIRINGKEILIPFAIALSNKVPPILGRVKALDLFLVEFDHGKELRLE